MLKRETTVVYGGMPTPEDSTSGTITPKGEESVFLSGDMQAFSGSRTNHGLYIDDIGSFSSQAADERNRRSASGTYSLL